MMRVTDKITSGTFLTNNRRMRSNLIGSYTRIMTQRRFNRVSEDSINGAKAMMIRRDLRDLDIYNQNLSSVKQLLTEAETSLTYVANKCYISVEEQLTAATNETHDQMELNILSTTLDQIAEKMVDTLNADFSERQIFGGTNNSTPPFEIGRYCVTDENNTIIFPPYFYDYHVGEEATQKQVDAANKALETLSEYNAKGNTADDKELADIKRTLEKLSIELHVTDGNKYSASVKTDNGKGEKITVLAYGGSPQTIKCSVAENPIIAEAESAAKNVQVNGTATDAEKEALARVGLTVSINDAGEVKFKDSKGLFVNVAADGTIPDDIKNAVPKEVTVTAENPDIDKANNVLAQMKDAAAKDKADIAKANAAVFKNIGLTVEVDDGTNTVTFKDADGKEVVLTDSIPKDIASKAGASLISKQSVNDVKYHLTMVDVPREVTYNGIPVNFDVMHKMTDANGNKFDIQPGAKYTIKRLNNDFTWDEGTEITPNVQAAVMGRDNSRIFPGSDPIYVDIGLGIKYDKDNDYKVDPQTALDSSFNGASIIGCGLDDDGYSKNLIQLVLDSARALRNGDQSTPNAIIDKANAANNNILIEVANLGSKYNSVEFYQDRNLYSKQNLYERQNLVEGTDMETEISYFESLRAAYEASLKVGTQIIPNTIFNYI